MQLFTPRLSDRFAHGATLPGGSPNRRRDHRDPPRTITGEAMIAIDAAECITFLNPVAESLTGWLGHDAVGRPVGEVLDVVDEITRIPIIGALVSLARKEQFSKFAKRALLVSRDEREYAVEGTIVAIPGPSGRTEGWVIVVSDANALAGARLGPGARYDDVACLRDSERFDL